MKRRHLTILCIALLTFLSIGLLPAVVGAAIQNPKPSNQNSKYSVPAIAPGDWPMYGRDVSRTNYNPDETTINSGNLAQLVQRWQVNIGSNGTPPSGAPSVANGTVFVGSSTATGNNFFAFDAISGSPVWSTTVGYVSSCFNVGIGSTSAISGTILSVGGGDSAFYGLDTTNGAQLWRNPMNVGSSGFPWESPLLAYGRSYVGIASRCDNPSVRGEVRAVDMNVGSQINNQYFVPSGTAGAGIWNSPALSPDGSTLAVVTGEDYSCGANCAQTRAMLSLDPLTLSILQFHQEGSPGADQDFGTTPVIFHDSQNRTLVGANHKNGIFYAYVLNNISAGPVWSKSTGTSVGMMPAYDPTFGSGGTVFIYGNSRIYAVDPATGTDRWPSVSAGTMHGNMAIANGLIFANMGTGGLRIMDETNGSTLRTLSPTGAGSANSGLAVSNGFIYWLSGSYINAWSLGGTPGPTNTSTNTPTVTPTSPPTNTPTITSTPTRTGSPTPTATYTPSVPPSSTVTHTPSNTPTGAPTNTPVSTNTPTDTPSGASPTSTPTPCANTFTDVHPTDYYYDPVTYLYCHGAISGYADNTFRPGNLTTRGQLTKIVTLAEGWPVYTPPSPTFRDVPTTDTFYQYIETAYSHNIISGYSCGTGTNCLEFRPGNNVTRGQLTKIVVLAENWEITPPSTPTFRDVPLGDTFYGYIETAYSHNIISGYDCGTGCLEFRPGNNATRGQISKIVYLAVTGP
ncbi:MAG: S-layer homology domain-containing protein [Chloroflexia bacterium]